MCTHASTPARHHFSGLNGAERLEPFVWLICLNLLGCASTIHQTLTPAIPALCQWVQHHIRWNWHSIQQDSTYIKSILVEELHEAVG